MVPATRGFFQDERARGGGARHVLFETLVRIPLGTALPEEVIFRGSLLGLFTQRHSLLGDVRDEDGSGVPGHLR